MKLRAILTLAAVAATTTAEPVDAWASGVCEQSGWRDYNKSFNGKDDQQCWAITAANLIDWWQELHADTLPAGTPRGEEILHTFTQSFANDGSDPDEGISWWFTGEYKPGRDDCAALLPDCPGGYLKSLLLPGQKLQGTLLTAMREEQVTAESAAKALIDGALKGAAFWIGVSYTSPKGRSAMHSLNVWGIQYDTLPDGTHQLCGIWIADSDDRMTGLCYVPLKSEGGLLVFNFQQHPIYSRIRDIRIDTITILTPNPPVIMTF